MEESPHKCPVCSRSFNQRSNLKTHLLTHTDHKPYECGSCGKVFRRNCDLRRHALTHAVGDVPPEVLAESESERSPSRESVDRRRSISPNSTQCHHSDLEGGSSYTMRPNNESRPQLQIRRDLHDRSPGPTPFSLSLGKFRRHGPEPLGRPHTFGGGGIISRKLSSSSSSFPFPSTSGLSKPDDLSTIPPEHKLKTDFINKKSTSNYRSRSNEIYPEDNIDPDENLSKSDPGFPKREIPPEPPDQEDASVQKHGFCPTDCRPLLTGTRVESFPISGEPETVPEPRFDGDSEEPLSLSRKATILPVPSTNAESQKSPEVSPKVFQGSTESGVGPSSSTSSVPRPPAKKKGFSIEDIMRR
ncbi:hypothetical protein RUM44_009255 [Polyplax serrata]|uniref:C2H2-type domain-containing protein n=1 Tax=Polyplax serrata TaxID=468196 RepID=A0ABR1ASF2_POLSC